MIVVLDASAILALIWEEQGSQRVEEVLEGAKVSAINLAEVVSKLVERGASDAEASDFARNLSLEVVPFDRDHALAAGLLRRATRPHGLSLGDRACLALAASLGAKAVTADRSWSAAGTGVDIEAIR